MKRIGNNLNQAVHTLHKEGESLYIEDAIILVNKLILKILGEEKDIDND